MALDGPVFGVYTKEQIELFYPLFVHEHVNGYQYTAPVRNQFRAKYGMKGINHYTEFCKDAFENYPDFQTNFPSLETLIAGMVDREHTEEKPKKRRCSIM